MQEIQAITRHWCQGSTPTSLGTRVSKRVFQNKTKAAPSTASLSTSAPWPCYKTHASSVLEHPSINPWLDFSPNWILPLPGSFPPPDAPTDPTTSPA